MGRGWIVILLLVFSISYSQNTRENWQIKSDSAYSLIKQGKANKALSLINSIENEIKIKGINEGVDYVNFLYRKAVTYYILEKPNSIDYLNETIIALNNDYIHKVAFNTNKFLGDIYFKNMEDSLAFMHYSKSVEIESDNNVNKNLENALYRLMFLESKDSNFEKYRKQFIDLKKSQGDTLNLPYAIAFKLYNYDQQYLHITKEILEKNKEKNLIADNIDIYEDLMFYYSNKKKFKQSVKYGNKLYKTALETSNLTDYILRQYCAIMGNSFYKLGDDINNKRLSTVCDKIENNEDIYDYFNILNNFLNNGQLEKFENHFYEFEDKLKSNIQKKDYADELLTIYSISLNLYENGKVFNKKDIENQFSYLDNYKSNLNKLNIEVLKGLKAEFYFFSNQFDILEIICDKFNRSENIELNLSMYFIQALAEYRNQSKIQKGLPLFLREIDECNCINQPQYIRYYGLLISGILNEEETYKWSNKALKLINEYNLKNTTQGINLRVEIARQFAANNNTSAAIAIYIDIYNNLKNKDNFNEQELALIQALYGLGEIYLVANDFKNAKIYLEELEKLSRTSSPTIENLREGYQNSLRMRYLFRSEQYLEHKEKFESLKLKDKFFEKKLKDLETDNYILSKYFLEKKLEKTIELFRSLLNGKPSLRRAELLFTFELTDNPDNPKIEILLDALKVEYNSFSAKADLLNRREFLSKMSNIQTIIVKLSNFLDYLSEEQLNQLIQTQDNLKRIRDRRNKKQFSNKKNLELVETIKRYRSVIEKELEKVTRDNKLIDSLEFELNKFERIVNSETSEYNNLTFKPLESFFNEKDVYIQYFETNGFYNEITEKYWSEPTLFAIIISKKQSPKVIKIGEINRDIIDIIKETYDKNIKLESNYEHDKFVWNYMINPLYNSLSGFENIYVQNNGSFGFINIEAIQIPQSNNLLIDKFKINRTDAVYKVNDKVSGTKKLTSIGVFGNPDFKTDENQSIVNENVANINRSATSDILDIKLSYLKGAREEIKLIEKKASDFGIISKIYDFSDASESNLKADNNYDVLHIATHAYDLNSIKFDNENNSVNIFGIDNNQTESKYYGFKNKGLFFSGSQNTINKNEFSGYTDNGILNGNEITNMELDNVKLVVLSACNTIDSSGKGFTSSGLDEAFLIAGAKEVLATLWDIDDQKTQEFMNLFYENYFSNNITALEALNKTKKHFRKLNIEPYYWAPFVIVR